MREPDLDALPANLHPKLKDVIRRCLAKNRKDRWHAIADVRVDIEAILDDPHGRKLQRAGGAARRPLWRAIIPIAITAIVVAAVTAFVDRKTLPVPQLNITQFPIVLSDGQRFTNPSRHIVAISPDGTSI